MTVIGVTGPSGAGKSTMLKEIERMGGRAIDCDQVYSRLLWDNEEMRREMAACFGPVFGPDGSLNRRQLAEVVFSDPNALQKLNEITHAHVKAEVERLLAQARAEGVSLVAVEAIALLESGVGDWCDAVVGILAPRQLRVARMMAREGLSEEAAQKRAAAQKPDSYFEAHCRYLLRNEGDRQAFLRQVNDLLTELTAPNSTDQRR